MISETVLLWLATMALVIDYVGLSRSENGETQLITLAFALVFWGAFAIDSSNYALYSGASDFSQSSEALVMIGVLGAVVTFIMLVASVFREFQRV